MLHESSMACLLEGVLAACPSLMLPLKLMLLHKGAHGHMHNPIKQLVLLAALAVIARAIPLRLYIILILGNRGASWHLDCLACERLGLG